MLQLERYAWFRQRRLLVSGDRRLPRSAGLLLTELGRLLAAEDRLIVMTGGREPRNDAPGAMSADRSVVDGMLSALKAREIDPTLRIETYLPEEDLQKADRFREGRLHVLYNRARESRRVSMVLAADVIVTIGGDHGTPNVINTAVSLDRPILPLPGIGRASGDAWWKMRADFIDRFSMTDDDVALVEQALPEDPSDGDLQSRAKRLLSIVLRGFSKTCFVVMPFQDDFRPAYEQAIAPALIAHGLTPVRTDMLLPAGNIITAIREGIRQSYFVIVDTTGDRPNVMYELGLAHADDKPVVLLRQLDADGKLPTPPFDFLTESIIGYRCGAAGWLALRQRIEEVVTLILGR